MGSTLLTITEAAARLRRPTGTLRDAATATATATDVGGPRHAQNPTTVARSA
jgi:hypothetical protein